MDVEQRFRDSDEYHLLEPYVDSEGFVAGYRVERLLHRDPWGRTVYQAATPDGRRVELKLFHPRSAETRREAKRLQQRIRQRASITHTHLLPVFGWGKVGDQHYLATAFCQEPTLDDLLRAAPLRAQGSLRLLAQLADALETAHERGLVHRELAPRSVFVAPRAGGHVLLGDFGVANPDWGSGLLDLTEPTAYLPPERLRGEPLAPESNVYSLACILVECLTGSPPYTSELPGAVTYAHAAEPPPRLSERRPELPVAIDDLVAAAMAKDPEERPGSARWLIATAAESLALEPSPLHSAHQSARPDSAPERRTSIDRRIALRRLTSVEHLPHPDLGRRLAELAHVTADKFRIARRRLPSWEVTVRRDGLVLALAAVVAGGGALGFILGRSGADEATLPPTRAADAARLGPERERATPLRRTDVALVRLNSRRTAARRRLAKARTPLGQAAAAAEIAVAYRTAARMVPPDFRAGAPVASTLNEAGNAYRRLAVAARRRDRRGYAAANTAARRIERDLQEVILQLNDVGP